MSLQRSFVLAAVLLTAASSFAVQTRPNPNPTPAPEALRGKSLADVAAQIRLKRVSAQPGRSLVITNENLTALAAGAELTEVTSEPIIGAVLSGGTSSAEGDSSREYWRGLYLDQVATIEALEARRESLESQIPALWNQFYAWDDPHYRDGVIKPQLDAAMQELDGIKAQLPAERERLPLIIQQARREGAEPGWFRDLPRP